jgi:hypothetical protein
VALSKLAANSFDLTDNYALTGTVTGATSTQKLFLIKNLDASSSSTLSFVDGASSVVLDNTYKTYLFRFINIHCETNDKHLTFQTSTDSGSSYGVTLLNTNFRGAHKEDGSFTFFGAVDNNVEQATSFAVINEGLGNANDASASGELWLFNPSNTTFVKHYMSQFSGMNFQSPPQATNYFTAGYFNTTSAIDAIQFKMSSGNIDSGRIALYGIK